MLLVQGHQLHLPAFLVWACVWCTLLQLAPWVTSYCVHLSWLLFLCTLLLLSNPRSALHQCNSMRFLYPAYVAAMKMDRKGELKLSSEWQLRRKAWCQSPKLEALGEASRYGKGQQKFHKLHKGHWYLTKTPSSSQNTLYFCLLQAVYIPLL